MKIEKKSINSHQIELTIRVPKVDAQPWLTKAANHLSQHRPIKGFRPGKAPYEIIKKEFGEAAIIQEAMEDIINGTFAQALEQENLDTYGKIGFELLPALGLDEIAAYKAMITLMPKVRLGNWQSQKIKRSEPKVSDEELKTALDELAGMVTTEEPVERPAQMNDKVIMDFEVFVDGKLIEGGKAQDFGLILGEGKMIPGFEEKIVGGKASQKLEFNLNFPPNYQAGHLSGKPAEFKITVKQVFARIKPEINDEFAKRMGVTDLNELKNSLRENIHKEKLGVEEERVEIAAIKQVVMNSEFDEIPKVMIDDTTQDLVHDFEHTLVHQGVKLEQYLSSIGKNLDQIKKEFEAKALERIKSSMALGQLAESEQLTITTDEITAEIEAQKKSYAHNHEALHDINQPEYKRHVASTLINRKIIRFIKDKIVE